MNPSLPDRLRSTPASAVKLARDLFLDLAPKILFFFSAFLMMVLMYKCFVAQYSVTFSAFTGAAVAGLVLGKVIPVLEWAESGHTFATHRRIVVIGARTLIYALVVIVLWAGEKIFEVFHSEGSLSDGYNFVVANTHLWHFLGLVLLISTVVGSYLTLQEIDRAMGKGALYRLLFQRPANE